MKIEQLPVELLMKIFSYLDTRTDVLLVNKYFYGVACKVDSKVCLRINDQIDSKLVHIMKISHRRISKLEIKGPLVNGRQLIIDVVERFSATLRTLKISKVNLQTFLEILSLTPNVEHLILVGVYCCAESGLSKQEGDNISGVLETMKLKSLSITGCDDECVEAFHRLPDGVLAKLVLSGFQWNAFTDLLNRQSHIKALQLGLIRGDWDGETSIFDRLKLESLFLRGDKMNGVNIASILSKQTKLKSLAFHDDAVVDEHVLNALADHMELEALSMNVEESPVAPLENIANLKKLKDLTLRNGLDRVDKVKAIAELDCSSVEKLILTGYIIPIPDRVIGALARTWLHLKHLTISKGQISLGSIMTHFNSVEVLDIMTDDVKLFDQQNYSNPQLKELKICVKGNVITKPWLAKLAVSCPNLSKLKVATNSLNCDQDECHIELKPILSGCAKLESLMLHCSGLYIDDWSYFLDETCYLKFMTVGYLADDWVPPLRFITELRRKFGVVNINCVCLSVAIDQNAMNRGKAEIVHQFYN